MIPAFLSDPVTVALLLGLATGFALGVLWK